MMLATLGLVALSVHEKRARRGDNDPLVPMLTMFGSKSLLFLFAARGHRKTAEARRCRDTKQESIRSTALRQELRDEVLRELRSSGHVSTAVEEPGLS